MVSCQQCEKKFTLKKNLVVHYRKHHFGGLQKTANNKKIMAKIKELAKKTNTNDGSSSKIKRIKQRNAVRKSQTKNDGAKLTQTVYG